MTDWTRGRSFNPAVRVSYGALEVQAAEENEEGREKGGDGRGEAAMGGAPRPQPGDELYATIMHAQADKHEQDRRADIVARRDHDYTHGPSIFAMAMLAEAARSSDQQQQPPLPVQEATHQGWLDSPQTSFQAMRAEQADIPARPSLGSPVRPGDSVFATISEKSHQEIEALWEKQAQERTKQQSMGLSL